MGFFSPGNRFLFAAQNAIIAGMKRFRDIFLFLLFAFVFSAFSYSLPQKKRTSRNVFSESKSVNSESDFFTESEEEVSSLSAGEENLLKSIINSALRELPYFPKILLEETLHRKYSERSSTVMLLRMQFVTEKF